MVYDSYYNRVLVFMNGRKINDRIRDFKVNFDGWGTSKVDLEFINGNSMSGVIPTSEYDLDKPLVGVFFEDTIPEYYYFLLTEFNINYRASKNLTDICTNFRKEYYVR